MVYWFTIISSVTNSHLVKAKHILYIICDIDGLTVINTLTEITERSSNSILDKNIQKCLPCYLRINYNNRLNSLKLVSYKSRRYTLNYILWGNVNSKLTFSINQCNTKFKYIFLNVSFLPPSCGDMSKALSPMFYAHGI